MPLALSDFARDYVAWGSEVTTVGGEVASAALVAAIAAADGIKRERFRILVEDDEEKLVFVDGRKITFPTGPGRLALLSDITGGVTDHGALTGLGDDDHTQYHTDARGDARYSLLGHAHAWSDITSGLPTTLAGYGITDAIDGSLTAGRVPFASDSNTLDDDSVFLWDDTTKRLAIGTSSPSSGVRRLDVRDLANTATSATQILARYQNTLNPAGASTATNYGSYIILQTDSANAQNFSASAGMRIDAEHLGSGTATVMQGGHFVAASGPAAGAPSGSGRVTDELFGVITDARINSTSAGTSALACGVEAFAQNRSPGTGTTVVGLHAGLGTVNGGSGAGTITNGYFARFDGKTAGGADALAGGTITTAIGVEIGDWDSGPTYTNPPVGLKLLAQTASGAYAIQNLGGLNYHVGKSRFGGNTAPTVEVDVTGAGRFTGALNWDVNWFAALTPSTTTQYYAPGSETAGAVAANRFSIAASDSATVDIRCASTNALSGGTVTIGIRNLTTGNAVTATIADTASSASNLAQALVITAGDKIQFSAVGSTALAANNFGAVARFYP